MRYPFTGSFPVTQRFGVSNAALTGGIHQGTDFGLPSGTPVLALAGGTVFSSGFDRVGGNFVRIRSASVLHSYYHLSVSLVRANDVVVEGQTIGISGSSGLSTGPHLHLEINVNGTNVDPVSHINSGVIVNIPVATPAVGVSSHTIVSGDTFWDIENANNMEHGKLQTLNPGIDPRSLVIGSIIRLVANPVAVNIVSRRTYSITSGDTFWDLENAWQLDHGTLQSLNPDVNPRRLAIGQMIIISR